MLFKALIISILCLNYVSCESRADNSTELTSDEASVVAQTFVDAGLNGFILLRVSHNDRDFDSCNLLRTTIYEVELHSTGEIFEISTEQNITNAQNCRWKYQLVQAISHGNITRVQFRTIVGAEEVIWEEKSTDFFRENLSTIVPEDFRILNGKSYYEFDIMKELIELHVKMMRSGDEYLINLETELEFFGPVAPRRKAYPPKVLLSLLGGGSYSKMKKIN